MRSRVCAAPACSSPNPAPAHLFPPRSKAEKAGLTLGKIEKLGLLSTAERLGLLTLAEDVLTSDPGRVTTASIPFILAGLASLVLIPHDSLVQSVASYGLGGTLLAAGGALFIGGFLVKGLQD